MQRYIAAVIAAFCLLSTIALAQKSGKAAQAEKTIRDLDTAWSQAAQNKNLDKTVSFYADDASALPFNAPIATGKEQIRNLWSDLMAKPGFSLTFAPSKIEIAKSADIAYEVGTFELKMNDDKGNLTTIPGKFVVAWKRQPKGDWKVELDIFNTDK